MVQAKFQDHRTSGCKEEDFLRFLPYNGMRFQKKRCLNIVDDDDDNDDNGRRSKSTL